MRMLVRGAAYQLSQRCRKLIEELFGEGKDWHSRRRGGHRIQQKALLIGWVLNLKRLAKTARSQCSRSERHPGDNTSSAGRPP
jgi:hypothetical protein